MAEAPKRCYLTSVDDIGRQRWIVSFDEDHFGQVEYHRADLGNARKALERARDCAAEVASQFGAAPYDVVEAVNGVLRELPESAPARAELEDALRLVIAEDGKNLQAHVYDKVWRLLIRCDAKGRV